MSHMNEETATLMVMGCLVAAVLFLCFSLAMINLSNQCDPGETQPQKNSQARAAELEDGKERLSQLQKRIAALTEEIQERERQLRQKQEEQKAGRQQELAEKHLDLEKLLSLKKQLAEALTVAEKKMAALQSEVGEGRKQEVEARLQKVLEHLARLKGLIQEKEGQLALAAQHRETASRLQELEQELAELHRQKEALHQQAQAAQQRDKEFDPRRKFAGSIHLKHPLFVECNAQAAVIHPEKKQVAWSELNKKPGLAPLAKGHDGLVFLVRPQGFVTFNKCFQAVKKLNLKICYEPVDADWNIVLTGEKS